MRTLEMHASLNEVKRSAGHSAVAAAAYRSGACFKDERTGIEDEYQLDVTEKPDSNFYREGRMAVVFNGDHYHLRIMSDGRLFMFHAIS